MQVADENSPYYAVPVGSRLILNQSLSIPADKARIYIQQGKIVSYIRYDQYSANCQFEVNTVVEVAQTIKPDAFIVTRVSQDIEVSRFYPPGTLLAQSGDNHDDVMEKMYSRLLYLKSSRQPDVRMIRCGRWDHRGFADHLTINEIREALGTMFTLELSAE